MIGRTLAHYRITAALGAGGMGEVYRATDTRLHRDVALKVLPVEMAASPDRLERFRREARAVAALNHPHIVTIHSVEEAGGVHFLTMELVEGGPLDRLIHEGGLPLTRLLEVAAPLADALATAHEKGIVHRDLKPANVMVTADGRVKVLDFGLAKIAAPAVSGQPRSELPTEYKTAEGVVMGTLPYMSPEQVSGRRVDARTDIFSMGVLLHEMATGRRPFQGSSSAELASAILRDTPPPIAETRADLPRELVRIVARCLEKEPGDRFPTARDLCNALRDLRAGPPVEGATATLAGPAPVDLSERNGRSGLAIAVLPFADMSPGKDQAYLCEGMAEEIMNALVRIEGIRVASRTSTFRASQGRPDLAQIGRALSVDEILEGSVRTAGKRLRVTAQLSDVASGYQIWSERFDRDAEDVFAVQDEIAAGVVTAVRARLAPGNPTVPVRPQVGNLEAYRLYLKGRYLRHTKNDHRAALDCFDEAIRLDPSHAPSWVAMAEVNVLAAHYAMIPAPEAYAKAREALATAARLQGESAEALYVEGVLAFAERRWPDWLRTQRRAIELQSSHVQAQGSHGLTLCTRGFVDEGLPHLERAREADPLAAFPYAISGVALLAAGRPRQTDAFFDTALTFEKENTLALWGSGVAQVAQGRFDQGIARLEQAVQHSRRAAFFVGLLGWALATAGRTDEAGALLDELRARPEQAPAAVSEAWLLAVLGDADAAWEVLGRAERECQAFILYTGLPPFDALRDDARFGALQRRLGLPIRTDPSS